jgi:hypothetical protein
VARERCNKSHNDRRQHPAVRTNREKIIKLKAEAGYLMRCKLDLVHGADNDDIAKEIERYNIEHNIRYIPEFELENLQERQRTMLGGGRVRDHGSELECRINARLVKITDELKRLSRDLETV